MSIRVRVYQAYILGCEDTFYIYAHSMNHALDMLREKVPKYEWNLCHIVTWSIDEIGSFPVGTLIKGE